MEITKKIFMHDLRGTLWDLGGGKGGRKYKSKCVKLNHGKTSEKANYLSCKLASETT